MDATAKLQGARTDQREAELAIEDFVSAIGEANRQLEVLQTERGEAFTIANRRRERAMGFREAISKKQRWSMYSEIITGTSCDGAMLWRVWKEKSPWRFHTVLMSRYDTPNRPHIGNQIHNGSVDFSTGAERQKDS